MPRQPMLLVNKWPFDHFLVPALGSQKQVRSKRLPSKLSLYAT